MANDTPAGDRVPLRNQTHLNNDFNSADKPSKDACTWAMLCHIAGLAFFLPVIVGGIIGPLIIWQIKKDMYPFVNMHGKEALNFQISMLIYAVISGVSTCCGIGLVLLPVVLLTDIVFTLIAAIKAGQGEPYRYPLTIRFVS